MPQSVYDDVIKSFFMRDETGAPASYGEVTTNAIIHE